MITNMTEGSPSKILWKFSLPMLLSVAFQQLYSIVDSVVAGKFIGVDALAAVGASFPITMIFMAIATGCSIGSSVIVSQLFGAKENARMKTAVHTSVISVLILSAILTIAGIIGCSSMIKMLNTPSDIFADSSLYLSIYTGGLIFLFLYNICTGIFTALGDSKTPLIFLIISSLGNIVLDLLFVIIFELGIAGVAWATFIAQGASSLLALFTLISRLHRLKTEHRPGWFSAEMFKSISKIAVPSILQQSFISVGNLLIQGLINGYGSNVIAGYSAAVRLNTFAIMSFTALTNGLSSFCAQNIGAKLFDRVSKGFKASLVMGACVIIPFTVVFFLFGSDLMKLFLDSNAINQEVLDVGTAFLKIVSPFYAVIALKLMADGVLRGASAMKLFMLATFTDLALRVILAFILSPILGSSGIWWSWPIGWITSMIMSMLFYIRGHWKNGLQ